MRPRFLAAIPRRPTAVSKVRNRLQALKAQHPSLRLVLDHCSVMVMAERGPVSSLGGGGVLLGSLFEHRRPARLSPQVQDEVRSTLGGSLIDNFWGGYVAILGGPSSEGVSLIRAPLGDLPCYWAEDGGLVLAASDVSLLLAAGLSRPGIDEDALARYLLAEDLRTSWTCLEGIRELRGGGRLTVAPGAIAADVLWSPWSFAAGSRQVTEAREAARRVHVTALDCVQALATEHRSVVLKLSGGLDSSIVAACLARTGRKVTALNLVTSDPAGDERHHARRVAEALALPMIERLRDSGRVDLSSSLAARLPRPTARAFLQQSNQIAAEIALETGSSAVFDGGGGDNVFCSLHSPRPAADCLLSKDGRPHFWKTAKSIARLSQTSLWTVAATAWLRTWRSPAYRWDRDMRYLSPDLAAAAITDPPHPWLIPPPGSLPGKSAHVALIAAAQSVAEGFDPEETLPTISPLIAQPLVEACLEIPSWLWFANSLNRAVARTAFARDLPEATIRRRSKGAPDSFLAELFERNRSLIRSSLLHGVLAERRLLDRQALAAALDDSGPLQGHDFVRILRLMDVEAWARSWI